MQGDGIEVIEHAVVFHTADEERVDWRYSAEYLRQFRILGCDGVGGDNCHLRKQAPFRIDFRIPMRFVVRLVPDHCSFDHLTSPAGFNGWITSLFR